MSAGSLEYALARMQARLGRRPDESGWSAMEHARDLAPVLDLARETWFHDAVKDLPERPDAHAIDRAMRAFWRGLVAEVASWMPAAWNRAIAWCAIVPWLPAAAHLARGLEPAAWMREDSVLADLCKTAGEEQAPASGELAPIARTWRDPDRLGEAWREEWRRRLPEEAARDESLAQFAAIVAKHLAAFGRAAPHEAAGLRRAFERRALAAFRRHGQEPVGAFAWLALAALDLERLRGELARRTTFPQRRPAT